MVILLIKKDENDKNDFVFLFDWIEIQSNFLKVRRIENLKCLKNADIQKKQSWAHAAHQFSAFNAINKFSENRHRMKMYWEPIREVFEMDRFWFHVSPPSWTVLYLHRRP